MGALAKKRADLFIVEASDNFDDAGIFVLKAGGNQCLNSGKRAELVIDAPRKYELFVQAAELGRLSVKKLKLPIHDAAIWMMLVNTSVWWKTALTVLYIHLSCYCLYQPLRLCSREGTGAT